MDNSIVYHDVILDTDGKGIFMSNEIIFEHNAINFIIDSILIDEISVVGLQETSFKHRVWNDRNVKHIKFTNKNQNVKVKLELMPSSKVTRHGSFLSLYYNLETCDLSEIGNIISIPDKFMADAENLQHIKFPICDLSDVGNEFLRATINLKAIDLLPLKKLQKIGNRFLQGCNKITSVILPENTINEIGSYFLYGCVSLTTFVMPKNNIRTINTAFLYSCKSLKKIIFPKCNIVTIDDSFAVKCDALETIDISQIKTLNYIRAYFNNIKYPSLKYIHINKSIEHVMYYSTDTDVIQLIIENEINLKQITQQGTNTISDRNTINKTNVQTYCDNINTYDSNGQQLICEKIYEIYGIIRVSVLENSIINEKPIQQFNYIVDDNLEQPNESVINFIDRAEPKVMNGGGGIVIDFKKYTDNMLKDKNIESRCDPLLIMNNVSHVFDKTTKLNFINVGCVENEAVDQGGPLVTVIGQIIDEFNDNKIFEPNNNGGVTLFYYNIESEINILGILYKPLKERYRLLRKKLSQKNDLVEIKQNLRGLIMSKFGIKDPNEAETKMIYNLTHEIYTDDPEIENALKNYKLVKDLNIEDTKKQIENIKSIAKSFNIVTIDKKHSYFIGRLLGVLANQKKLRNVTFTIPYVFSHVYLFCIISGISIKQLKPLDYLNLLVLDNMNLKFLVSYYNNKYEDEDVGIQDVIVNNDDIDIVDDFILGMHEVNIYNYGQLVDIYKFVSHTKEMVLEKLDGFNHKQKLFMREIINLLDKQELKNFIINVFGSEYAFTPDKNILFGSVLNGNANIIAYHTCFGKVDLNNNHIDIYFSVNTDPSYDDPSYDDQINYLDTVIKTHEYKSYKEVIKELAKNQFGSVQPYSFA